jgi:hypothetical protein
MGWIEIIGLLIVLGLVVFLYGFAEISGSTSSGSGSSATSSGSKPVDLSSGSGSLGSNSLGDVSGSL